MATRDAGKATARTPLKARIETAMAGRCRMQYHDLMAAVFPSSLFPKAMRYQANGGPPGCAMAFGKALREMGWTVSGQGSGKYVFRRSMTAD